MSSQPSLLFAATKRARCTQRCTQGRRNRGRGNCPRALPLHPLPDFGSLRSKTCSKLEQVYLFYGKIWPFNYLSPPTPPAPARILSLPRALRRDQLAWRRRRRKKEEERPIGPSLIARANNVSQKNYYTGDQNVLDLC